MGGEEESSDRPEEASYGGKAVVNTKRASAGGVGDDDMLRWWRVLNVVDRRLRIAPVLPSTFGVGAIQIVFLPDLSSAASWIIAMSSFIAPTRL